MSHANALTVVRPLVVVHEDAALIENVVIVDSTVTQENLYASGVTYQPSDRIRDSSQRLWECVTQTQTVPSATNAAWRRMGWAMRYKCFDGIGTSRTAQASTFFYRVRPNQAVTHVAFIGMVAATSCRLIVANNLDQTVYDQTVNLTGVNNLIADQVFADLPSSATHELLFYFYGTASLAVAQIVFGAKASFGHGIHHGAALQLLDYSRKEADEFGEVSLVQRPFSRRAQFEMQIDRAEIDGVVTLLSSLRARPCLWVGHPQYQSTAMWGFYRDFSVDIAYSNRALCTLSIEGMTTVGPTAAESAAAPAPAPAPGSGGTTWSPTVFFSSGTVGAWYEASLQYLETTAAGGTKTAGTGDKVGRALDLSGNNRHAVQTSLNDRPFYNLGANNTPCVDLLNTLGLRGSNADGTSNAQAIAGGGSFYICVAMEVTTTFCIAISDTTDAASLGGIRVGYDNGSVFAQARRSSTNYTITSAFAGPGRFVAQVWFDSTNNTLYLKANDSAVTSISVGGPVGAGSNFVGLGMDTDSIGAWNQRIFFATYTRGVLPVQADRDACHQYALQRAGLASSTGSGGTGGTPTGTFPAKVLACYYTTWATGRWKLTDVPTEFNVVYLFHCKPGKTAGAALADKHATYEWYNQGDGSWFFEHHADVPSAMIQQVRNRGQKVILSLGGAGAGFILTTTAQRDAALTSIKSIISTMGGVDGIDINCYEHIDPATGLYYLNSSNIANFKAYWLFICQDLKTTYGANFAITTPTQPDQVQQREFAGHLFTNNCLTYVAPQYYDWGGFRDANVVRNLTGEWINDVLGKQHPVAVGLSANYPNGLTLEECVREWGAIKASWPDVRGMYCWSAQTNLDGGNEWGRTMRALL